MLLLLPSVSIAAVSMGTVTIKVGEEYHADASYSVTTTIQEGSWSKDNSNIIFVAKGKQSCTIRGNKVGTSKLSYSGYAAPPNSWSTYSIDCYWTIKVVSDGGDASDDNVQVKRIRINPSSALLKPGESRQLSAVVYPGNASNKSVSWSSSNNSIITINSDGVITAKNVGTAKITCTAKDGSGKKETCEVTVEENPTYVTEISLNRTSVTTSQGIQISYNARVYPTNASLREVTWSVSDTTLVELGSSSGYFSSNAYLNANKPGEVLVTCEANDGSGVKAVCKVKILKTFTAKTNEGINMTFTILDEDAKTCEVGGGDGNYEGFSWMQAISQSTSGRVTIPSTAGGYTVTQIHSSAFQYTKDITAVSIPRTVKRIGGGAFVNCYALKTVVGLDSVEYVGGNAFYKTQWYDNKPDGPLYIGKCLYSYISNNSSSNSSVFNVKEGTMGISSYAFEHSSNYGIESITIPASVVEIGNGAITCCSTLKSIIVDPNNIYYDSRNNCNAIIEKSTNILKVGCLHTNIPNEVKKIAPYAFKENGRSAPGDSIIIIPNNVEDIGYRAFELLADYNEEHGMKTLVIGKGVKKIRDYAFRYSWRLNKVVSLSDNPFDIITSVFDDDNYEEATLYVPKGTKDLYQFMNGWSKFQNIVDSIPQEYLYLLNDDDPNSDGTGISVVKGGIPGNAKIYDLQGRRLAKPVKGINIINGRKVVVK